MTRFLALLVALGFASRLTADDPDYSKDLPRIAPTAPADALKSFVVKPGWKIEQVAAEPLLTSPVAMAWDENGKLYVVEMRGYSEDRDQKLSRITVLEDTTGDGKYDKSTIFADGLFWPTAVACWDGGVFVGDAPHIYYLKDTDGDGKADVRKVVYTGFGTHNVQGLLNSFHWTLDNRIHGTGSSGGGTITRPEDKNFKPVSINGRDFEFDPRSFAFNATSGGAQHGMCFDDWGRKFVSSNSDHIQQVMFEDRYIARNPYLVAPNPRVSIATDGPQAEVYRSSPVEPWRILRTKLRVTGAVQGIVEGGGRAAGYFTGATGVTIVRGDAMGDMKGLAVVADVGSNLIHRKKLTGDGLPFKAERIDKDSEWIASKDIWFRPVQFANGPDGCLYVIDMYRETIEHPASLPPAIKKHLDLTSGRDRGRLYRIYPEGHTPRALPKLGALKTDELVKLLDDANAWHRETVSRLLYQRQDKAAVPTLEKLLKTAETPFGKTHALSALDGLGKLTEVHVLMGLAHLNPRIVEHAIRLSERLPDREVFIGEVVAGVEGLDAQAESQLAFTLGYGKPDAVREALVRLARSGAANRWPRLAILSSAGQGGAALVDLLLRDAAFRNSDAGRAFLAELAAAVSRRDDGADAATLAAAVKKLPPEESTLILTLVKAVNDGGGKNTRTAVSTAADPDVITKLVRRAAAVAADDKQPAAARVDAIRSLQLGKPDEFSNKLVALLDTRQPSEVQLAALGVLDRSAGADVATALLKNWPTLSPRLRGPAGEVLLARADRVAIVLDAIEKKTFAPTELDATQVKRLLGHKDATIAKRAKTLLGDLKLARRSEVVEKYKAALEMKGDAAKGKAVFAKHCAACHRLEGVGTETGPNLSAMKNRGADAVLLNILDPNIEVNPQFVNYLANLEDGRQVSGTIVAETATSITFGRGEGQQDVVLRKDLASLKSTGLSLMPEGLEKDIDVAMMTDLIAYIMQVP